MRELHTDILVVGGGFGGVSAALAAAKLGGTVIVTEETDWIGGQATGQGVPPDEHPWIEQYGSSRSYREFRAGIRDYYRRTYPLSAAAAQDPHFNPGAGWVSAVGFEPRVGVAVLHEMLAPYLSSGRIVVLDRTRPITAEVEGDRIRAVSFARAAGSPEPTLVISAELVVDATELGEILELAGVEHVIGTESRAQTGEPSAPDGAPEPLTQQGFTHLLAVDYLPGHDHTIEKPSDYDRWRPRFERYGGIAPEPITEPASPDRMRWLFSPGVVDEHGNWVAVVSPSYESCIWNFRRVLCRTNFAPGAFASDVTMLMNGNEYSNAPLLGVSAAEAAQHREEARELSLSLLYYLQTEVEPGYGGKPGLPGLRPRGDVFGTGDGLAHYPYIRESRRIVAEFTALEQHFRRDTPGNEDGPMRYDDSVGVGGYRIDIHQPARRGAGSMTHALHGTSWPQQIALGSLIPVRVDNLLPACKNIGSTHVTNGCYRLHPTEWSIGEAAGALAAIALTIGVPPRAVREREDRLRELQRVLGRLGVDLEWPGMQYARSYNSHYVNVPDWYWGEAERL
jgi:hypothetical protein